MFKKGQFVRLVNNMRRDKPLNALTVGNLYVVEKDAQKQARLYDYDGSPLPNGVEDFILFIKNDEGKIVNTWASRFVLAKNPGVFEEGDRVRIIDNLEDWMYSTDPVPIPGTNEMAANPTVAEEMLQYAGQEFIVDKQRPGTECVRLYSNDKDNAEIRDWSWSRGWLMHVDDVYKPVEPFEVGMKVYVKGKGNEGVAPRWLPEQDKAIGKKKTVREVHKTFLVLSDGLAYQFVSCEKWNEEKHGVKKAKSLRAIIAQARKKAKPAGLCSFTIIQPGTPKSPDPKINSLMGQPCHAALNDVRIALKDGSTKGALAAIEHIGYKQKIFGKKEDKQAFVKYVDYIVNRSPWRSAFHPKQGRNVIKTGADINVDVSANVVAGGCIALRMSHEFQLAPNFGHFKKLGYDDHVAFLLAWSFVPAKEGYYIGSMTSGHSAIGGTDIGAGALLSFFRNGYNEEEVKPKSPWGAGVNRYKVIDPVANTKVDKKLSKEVQEAFSWRALVTKKCPTKAIGKGWDVKNVVPNEDVTAFAEFIKKELEA